MPVPVFIGDELSATAYRLAGVQVRVPDPAGLRETIRWAREHAPLVLISAGFANTLARDELDELLALVAPPIVLVPDIRGHTAVPNLSQSTRRFLGVLE